MPLGVQQRFFGEYIHVQVVSALGHIAVQKADKVVDLSFVCFHKQVPFFAVPLF